MDKHWNHYPWTRHSSARLGVSTADSGCLRLTDAAQLPIIAYLGAFCHTNSDQSINDISLSIMRILVLPCLVFINHANSDSSIDPISEFVSGCGLTTAKLPIDLHKRDSISEVEV